VTTPTAPTIVFLDTETTSLRPDRRAWDLALIVRRDGEPDVEHQWFVHDADLDLGNADPFALRIGHFYERHPAYAEETFTKAGSADGKSLWAVSSRTVAVREGDVLSRVEELTRGAHLVGCVPNFDAEVLGARMRACGLLPSWHYHLIDVEMLTVGYLRGLTTFDAPRNDLQELLHTTPLRLPWDSEALSRALDVEPPGEADRHTALGDARWARDMFDAVMGGAR
jgi:DNA polymerase III epsilon subunit-like protein